MFEQSDGEVYQHFTKIATQTATKTGTDFFHLLTKHLAEELHADSVYIGEFMTGSAEKVRTLALCVDGDVKPNFEFSLSGSPEAEVSRGSPSIHLSDLQSMFPDYPLLSKLKAQACIELPLIDSEQREPGLIGAFYRRPLSEVKLVQSLLEMFMPRVLAELDRIQTVDRLRETVDRLRENEERYRAFVWLNADAMWRIEFPEPIPIDQSQDDQVESIIQKGRLAECNPALARLLHKETPEQVIGGTAFDFLPPHLHKTYRKNTESMVRSGYKFRTIDYETLDKHGKPRCFLRTHWGIVEDGKLRRIWGSTREITDLKAQMKIAISEKRLSELVEALYLTAVEMKIAISEKQLLKLFEALHLAAIELDCEGTLSYCNDYLLRLTGFSREEIIGKNWFDQMVDPQDRERQRALFSARTKVPVHFDGTLICRDGHRLLVGWDYVVIRDPNGRIVSTVGACRDLINYAVLETLPRQSLPLVRAKQIQGYVLNDLSRIEAQVKK